MKRQAQTEAATPVRLSTIDQWRGISVLMVIVHHFVIFRFIQTFNIDYRLSDLIRHPTLSALPASGARLFYLWGHALGPLGVQIFFVISGYIITRLLLNEETKSGTICLRCFYIRRLFRILPALIFFVAVTELLSLFGILHITSMNLAASATFLCNTTLVDCGYYYGHLWSLGVEEQFYVLWPLAFLLLMGNHRVGVIWTVLALCLGISLIRSFWIFGWINNGLAFACIAFGAAYALSTRFRQLLVVSTLVPTWLAGLLLVVAFPLAKSLVDSLWVIWTVATPLFIVCVVLTRSEQAPERVRGGTAALLNRIGLMSYSLYLWHFVFAWEPDHYYSRWFLMCSLPFGLLMAWLSARFIEPFFIALGRKFAKRVSPTVKTAPATP